ncbi:MAG: hypothetical protein HXS47_08525 [Theionarchaea archaeon]|nr:hypothetical protein [Theionarchaea archaeon]
MIDKKYILFLILPLMVTCGCTGQGGLPPLPKDVLDFGASMEVLGTDQTSGDVTVEYTLIIKNKGDTALEKVILKDFIASDDVVMRQDYFVITDLDAGEEYEVIFNVVILGWAATNEMERTWEVDYTIRIEEGSAYTEQDVFYYSIHLYR